MVDANTGDLLISARDVAKKFTRSLKKSMIYGSADLFRSFAGLSVPTEKLRANEFWALENISFEIKRGEALGLIGENGSGKSTLLRIMAGIYPPDRGEILVRGKVGALIALGAGFHPHFSGRENVFLNGTMLGMNQKEIEQKFDSIVDFAELADFIDSPVANYSSGMTVRLGFSIAIHCDVDILIVDEILAVGDLSFALKCYRKFEEFRAKGGTTLLVSHNMQLIRNVCEKVLWLENGNLKLVGASATVCDAYESKVITGELNRSEPTIAKSMNLDPNARITHVTFCGDDRIERREFCWHENLIARIHFDCLRIVLAPKLGVSVFNAEGVLMYANFSNYDGFILSQISGKGTVEFSIADLNLRPGIYKFSCTLAEGTLNNNLDWHEKAYEFAVLAGGGYSSGAVNPFPTWKLV